MRSPQQRSSTETQLTEGPAAPRILRHARAAASQPVARVVTRRTETEALGFPRSGRVPQARARIASAAISAVEMAATATAAGERWRGSRAGQLRERGLAARSRRDRSDRARRGKVEVVAAPRNIGGGGGGGAGGCGGAGGGGGGGGGASAAVVAVESGLTFTNAVLDQRNGRQRRGGVSGQPGQSTTKAGGGSASPSCLPRWPRGQRRRGWCRWRWRGRRERRHSLQRHCPDSGHGDHFELHTRGRGTQGCGRRAGYERRHQRVDRDSGGGPVATGDAIQC